MRILWIVVCLVVLVVAGWTGAWIYAAHEAGRGLETWQRDEAAYGRHWTCPNRTVGGYPFALTIECSDATFAGQAMGQGADGSMAHVTAGISLAHPFSIAIHLTAPFAYKTSDGQVSVTGTWSRLDLSLASLPQPQTATLQGTDVAVHGLFGASGAQGGAATRLAMAFALRPDDADPTVDFTMTVAGTDVPPLDALMGGSEPVTIDLAGRLHRAVAGTARTPEEMMETWRRQGGTLDISQAAVTRGPSRALASGTLRLDDAHRPQGHLDAQFIGLEPILKRYGISGNLASAGALLGALFGGSRQAAPTQPGALALPISLQNGRLAVGPIRTQVMVPPLY